MEIELKENLGGFVHAPTPLLHVLGAIAADAGAKCARVREDLFSFTVSRTVTCDDFCRSPTVHAHRFALMSVVLTLSTRWIHGIYEPSGSGIMRFMIAAV